MNELKYFIAKIKLRIKYKHCYKVKEQFGIAISGCCRGHYHEDKTPYKPCSLCPYFVNIYE